MTNGIVNVNTLSLDFKRGTSAEESFHNLFEIIIMIVCSHEYS